MDWLGGLLGVGDALFGSHAQHKANRANLKLQREQQAWESFMSGSAVQRRAADIEAAGGNRALAFTNGQEASTPSVAPARMEPEYKSGGALGMMQMAQIMAQTKLTNAQAKGQEIKNNVENAFAFEVAALNRDLKEINKQLGAKQWDKIEQDISESLTRQGKTALEAEGTALSNERFQKMTDAVVRLAISQARAGELDVQALENLAQVYGIEANKSKGMIDTIINAIKTTARGAMR